jgi:hypothetical protein
MRSRSTKFDKKHANLEDLIKLLDTLLAHIDVDKLPRLEEQLKDL